MSDECRVYVPAPLEHQEAVSLSPARFKLLHHGRRWGKDRVALTAAVAGHGPQLPEGPLFPGIGHGWWVGWVVRDFTQGMGIWREEFLPRFESAKPHVQVNKADLRITLPNRGGLFLCTAENIASLRGLGKRMKGLVLNESAWFDLEEAWNAVLRALLIDNKGWAMFMSTPNSGLDGNPTGLTPSYFNRLCHEANTGALGAEWEAFGGDLRENPCIDPDEALSFLRGLGEGTLRQQEEGYGLLVQSGAGLAFPAWNPKVHLTKWWEPPREWACVLGMDWGIASESVITAYRVSPKKELLAVKEWSWKDKDAYEAGYDFAQGLLNDTVLHRWPEWLVVDSAMNERTGIGGSTILMEFQAGVDDALREVRSSQPLHILAAPKGPGSRAVGFNMVTKVLSWGPELADGTVPASRMPLLQIMRDQQGNVSCPMLAKDLATAPLDPKKKNDVDKTKCSYHCFVAGTKVLTPFGHRRIESLSAGDWVVTRTGIRRVLANWVHGPAPTVEVALSNGETLIGTGHHKIKLADGRSVALDTLNYGDQLAILDAPLSERAQWWLKWLYSRVLRTGDILGHPAYQTASISGEGTRDPTVGPGFTDTFTGIYGKTPTGRSLMGTTSTTETTTPATTTYRTSNASLKTFTSGTAIRRAPSNWSGCDSANQGFRRPLGRGERIQQIGSWCIGFTQRLVKRLGRRSERSTTRLPLSVSNVEKPSEPTSQHSPDCAPTPAAPPTGAIAGWTTRIAPVLAVVRRIAAIGTRERSVVVVGAPKPCGESPVYNLTVEHDHEYIANGVVVGNSGDSLNYALAMILPQADTLVEVVPENVHPGFRVDGQRRARERTPAALREERRLVIEQRAREKGIPVGGRYGPSRSRL